LKQPPKNIDALRKAILTWYRGHGRDLPWRRTRDPYAILVSEVMLQQTQVDRVAPKYLAFMERFPDFKTLAKAPFASVLREWSGLGYNGRARRLWECAKGVVREHRGRLPNDYARLNALPGIGPYTAGALAAIVFGERAATVDTNIRRVLGRALDGKNTIDDQRAWELAEAALPSGPSAEWNQALMDVGARFCRPRPKCEECPAQPVCLVGQKPADVRDAFIKRSRSKKSTSAAAASTRYHGSSRFYRGKVVKALTGAKRVSFLELGEQVKDGFGVSDLPWLSELLAGLARDGLIKLDLKRKTASLP